ncbi:hypothetical protein CJT48_26350 [Pseudomonas aeruginosa]|nr:hypothetical protein CJT48_26350 [Pseudomonas aeruginosa]
MGEHAQSHAFRIDRFAFTGSDKPMLNALHLTQVLIGQPMAFASLRKVDKDLLASRQGTLLHDHALP